MEGSFPAPTVAWTFPTQPLPRATTPTPLEINTDIRPPPSPRARTPSGSRLRAATISAIPRTPLTRICTDVASGSLWDCSEQSAGVNDADRPGSASSTHSQSSNFSFYSLNSGGGSCTSPEDEATFVFPSAKNEEEEKRKSKDRSQDTGSNDPHWTQEMDDHLWKTYTLYQQDARMTPFYVVPGGVPPLGVCCRVVRAAKKTWRQARMEEGVPNPKASPRIRIPRITIGDEPKSPTTNKGDMLRKSLPFEWPASESASRKRLRILCKTQYGPPVSFHNRHVEPVTRGPPHIRLRASRRHQSEDISSLSSFRSALGEPFSSRSMQLSLFASTSSTMRPDSILHGWSAGIEEEPETAPNSLPETHFLPPIASIPESPVVLPQQAIPTVPNTPALPRQEPRFPPSLTRFSTMPTQRSRAGSLMLDSLFDAPPPSLPLQPLTALPPLGDAPASPTQSAGLLPPLELKQSSSPFGTWPRRRRRRPLPSDTPSPPTPPVKEASCETTPMPAPPQPRRSLLSNVFGEAVPAVDPNATPIAVPRRTMNFAAVPGSAPGPAPRRRLNMTADTPYRHHRSSESLSSLSSITRFQSTGSEYLAVPGDSGARETPSRLGSPFRERKPTLKGRLVKSSESLGMRCSEIFGSGAGPSNFSIPARKSSLGFGGPSTEEDGRPVKRMKE